MSHSRLIGPATRCASAVGARWLAVAFEPAASEDEHEIAGQHADAGQSEAPLPTVGFAEIGAQDGRPETTQVDAEVLEREARVAARIVRPIELAHQGREMLPLRKPTPIAMRASAGVQEPLVERLA